MWFFRLLLPRFLYSIFNWVVPWPVQYLLAYLAYRGVRQLFLSLFATSLRGKNVLLTGAANSKGLGYQMAIRLAARGANLVLVDVDDRVADAAEACRAAARDGGMDIRVLPHKVDITNSAAVKALVDTISAELGPVDILINNAGVVHGKNLLELTEAGIRRDFEVNAISHFWTLRAVLPIMLARNSGSIVTIASVAGLVGADKLSSYCASKFSAVGLHESTRFEVKKAGAGNIHTLLVCPYFFNSGMFAGVKSHIPLLLPMLEPEYVADRVISSLCLKEEVLLLPKIAYTIPFFRAVLPVAWFDALLTLLGAQTSMDTFQGKGAEGAPDARVLSDPHGQQQQHYQQQQGASMLPAVPLQPVAVLAGVSKAESAAAGIGSAGDSSSTTGVSTATSTSDTSVLSHRVGAAMQVVRGT